MLKFRWILIMFASIISSIAWGDYRADRRLDDLETVAKWQSALMSVPPGTGMILTDDQDAIELGQEYNLPVGDFDSILVRNQEVFLNFHHFMGEVPQPAVLWYFDQSGVLFGNYIVPGYTEDFEVIVRLWDNQTCEYEGVDRFNEYYTGYLFIQEVWVKEGAVAPNISCTSEEK